jgi:hypothetical protein
MNIGCAVAQAVSRRLPTAAARVRAQLSLHGIRCGEKRNRFSPSTPVSHANHSIDFSTLVVVHHYRLSSRAGRYNMPETA